MPRVAREGRWIREEEEESRQEKEEVASAPGARPCWPSRCGRADPSVSPLHRERRLREARAGHPVLGGELSARETGPRRALAARADRRARRPGGAAAVRRGPPQ